MSRLSTRFDLRHVGLPVGLLVLFIPYLNFEIIGVNDTPSELDERLPKLKTTLPRAVNNKSSPFNFIQLPYNEGRFISVSEHRQVCTRNARNKHLRLINVNNFLCQSDSLGNALSEVYMMALHAFQRNCSFEVTCAGSGGSLQEIFWKNKIWTMKWPKHTKDLCQECTGFPHTCRSGLNYALPVIRATLQLLPPPSEIDDVVIHVRCGDVLKYAHHSEYGYPKYEVYKEYLSPLGDLIESIAILTSTERPKDSPFSGFCTFLVNNLARSLRSHFPRAAVRIRNKDTIVESVSRLLHARRATWCNPSTFCVYPAMAAVTGKGFIVKSPKLYPFVEEIADPNIVVVDRPFLNMNTINAQKMKAVDIVGWLQASETT